MRRERTSAPADLARMEDPAPPQSQDISAHVLMDFLDLSAATMETVGVILTLAIMEELAWQIEMDTGVSASREPLAGTAR